MVERIYRTERELNVALRVYVIENLERDVGNVLHIHIFVDDDDAFCKHGLAERPDGIHHFACLSRIGLANGDDHQIVEDAFNGKIDVDQFRDGKAHQREEDALDSFAHVSVLHRWLADDGCRINRIFAMSDASDVKDGIEIFERVETGVIAEGAFGAKFVEIDVTLENDFAGRGNFEVDSFASNEFDRGGAKESGDQIFLDVGRGRNNGGESNCGVGAMATATSSFPKGLSARIWPPEVRAMRSTEFLFAAPAFLRA
jgi:hypothetical protein